MATEVATLQFEADTRQLKAANDELAKTERTAVKAQDSARKWGTSLKNAANDSINPITKVSSGLTAVHSALLAIAGSMAIRELVSLTDQWTDLNSRLRNATGSVEAADEALQAISQTARTTYSSLQQTVQGFLQNNLVLTELGYTTREQLDLMDSLNNSLVVSGAKGEQAAMIMGAFGRAMAEGSLKGQELNLMMTYSARTVKALAEGLGVTTIEFKRMVAAGEIDATKMFEALTSQMQTLRAEAEDMPATIGDAMVQLGNFMLEATGRLDQATGLSASIADSIVSSLRGWNSVLNQTDQKKFNELLEERVMIEEKLQSAAIGQGTTIALTMQQRIDAINAEMMALSDANVERQKAESAAVTAGQEQRAITEQQRITDHQAELDRIEAEKNAKIQAERDARAITRAIRTGGALGGVGGIPEEVERKRTEQDELLRMTREWQAQMETEEAAANQKRVDAAAQQTQQLISFSDLLLQNKSQSAKAAASIGLNLLNQEKREAAAKIITDSYAAAMSAWKALAGIPFIGPALGAAAAGGIIAAGVSYSAKSLAGRALGGQVRGGESYVVGERGPEVLTMGSASGKIIPNSALSSAPMTGTVNQVANVNFSISTNDALGFEDLLTSSRGKIIEIINTALNDGGRGALI